MNFTIANDSNNGGDKGVLLSTEQLNIDDNDALNNNNNNTILNGQVIMSTNDEELTSLTWLHDKNLLNGECSLSISFAELSLHLCNPQYEMSPFRRIAAITD